ncbi:class II fructose-bisphosphate aldolase [Bacillus sp. DNRA2]|uniref:class II fructose-bisphosphate aldolase n=1 Tax=Bacillus sp. DNRA2 TaxID=2723053 RepID=UPI00145DE68A|nr:class II fructose-bisphosphate aldolase [Bacillus sp. DNRA2]NMD70392.1 class II fructose-bisphosphate aldolase [Bacillus sp. DNRA2]
MLVSLNELLHNAQAGNYAVGAFNCPTLESVRAVIEAAEELQVSVILSHAEVHNDLVPIEIIGPILVDFAKRASIPVAVHLDHGSNLDIVKTAIGLGFSSVMIDASHLNYEDNIKIVKEVVAYAQARKVSVEAELGVMTSSGLGGEDTERSEVVEVGDLYTDPLIAKDFVERTGTDALAASFGTVHGIYMTEPKLDFERLRAIHKNIKRPVVMHGGSGLSEADYRSAINNGVRKINYYSYSALAGAKAVKDFIEQNEKYFYHDITTVAKIAMKKDVKKAMEIFQNNKINVHG